MSRYTDALRARFPDLDKYRYNDAQIVQWVAQQTQKDPYEVGVTLGVIDPEQGDFSRGVYSSFQGIAGTLSGAGALFSQSQGDTETRDRRLAEMQRRQANVAIKQRPTDLPSGFNSIGDVVDSAQYWLGYGLPHIVGGLGAGAVGAKAAQVGVGAAARGLANKAVRDRLVGGAGVVGGAIGAGGVAFPQLQGETFGKAVDRVTAEGGSLEDIDLGRINRSALGATALDVVGTGALAALGRIAPFGKGVDLLNTNSGGFVSRTTKGLGIGGAVEGTTESFQEGFTDYGSGLSLDESSFYNPDAFYAGAIPGASVGGAGAAFRGGGGPSPSVDQAPPSDGVPIDSAPPEDTGEFQSRPLFEEDLDAAMDLGINQKAFRDRWTQYQIEAARTPGEAAFDNFRQWKLEQEIVPTNAAEDIDAARKFVESQQSDEGIRDTWLDTLERQSRVSQERSLMSPEMRTEFDENLAVYLDVYKSAVANNDMVTAKRTAEDAVDQFGEDQWLIALLRSGGDEKTPGTSAEQASQEPTNTADQTQAPGAGQAQTPGAGQAQAPGAGQAQTPGAGQAQTPGAGQAQLSDAERAQALEKAIDEQQRNAKDLGNIYRLDAAQALPKPKSLHELAKIAAQAERDNNPDLAAEARRRAIGSYESKGIYTEKQFDRRLALENKRLDKDNQPAATEPETSETVTTEPTVTETTDQTDTDQTATEPEPPEPETPPVIEEGTETYTRSDGRLIDNAVSSNSESVTALAKRKVQSELGRQAFDRFNELYADEGYYPKVVVDSMVARNYKPALALMEKDALRRDLGLEGNVYDRVKRIYEYASKNSKSLNTFMKSFAVQGEKQKPIMRVLFNKKVLENPDSVFSQYDTTKRVWDVDFIKSLRKRVQAVAKRSFTSKDMVSGLDTVRETLASAANVTVDDVKQYLQAESKSKQRTQREASEEPGIGTTVVVSDDTNIDTPEDTVDDTLSPQDEEQANEAASLNPADDTTVEGVSEADELQGAVDTTLGDTRIDDDPDVQNFDLGTGENQTGLSVLKDIKSRSSVDDVNEAISKISLGKQSRISWDNQRQAAQDSSPGRREIPNFSALTPDQRRIYIDTYAANLAAQGFRKDLADRIGDTPFIGTLVKVPKAVKTITGIQKDLQDVKRNTKAPLRRAIEGVANAEESIADLDGGDTIRKSLGTIREGLVGVQKAYADLGTDGDVGAVDSNVQSLRDQVAKILDATEALAKPPYETVTDAFDAINTAYDKKYKRIPKTKATKADTTLKPTSIDIGIKTAQRETIDKVWTMLSPADKKGFTADKLGEADRFALDTIAKDWGEGHIDKHTARVAITELINDVWAARDDATTPNDTQATEDTTEEIPNIPPIRSKDDTATPAGAVRKALEVEPALQSVLPGAFASKSTGIARFNQIIRNLVGKGSSEFVHVYNNRKAAIEGTVEFTNDKHSPVPAWAAGWVRVDPKTRRAHAFFDTSQIPRGREMAVFLHEVGAHMGFDNILKKPDREALLQTIKDMAQTRGRPTKDRKLERDIARKAISRADTLHPVDTNSPSAKQRAYDDEVLAYFVEYAVAEGISPRGEGPISKMLATLQKAVSVALNRLFGGRQSDTNIPRITVRQIVDLAYGAAHKALTDPKTSSIARHIDSNSVRAANYAGSMFDNLGQRMVTDFGHMLKKVAESVEFVHHIVLRVKADMPAADRWYTAMRQADATANSIKRSVDTLVLKASALPKERMVVVNKFIADSTISGAWGYTPAWLKPTEITVDPVLKRQFDRLPAAEQSIIQGIFAHGASMRARKMAIAKASGDDRSDMFNAGSETAPFAPLRRFGKFVGYLKSDQLVAAEKAYTDAPSNKTDQARQALYGDDKHYQVQFFGSLSAAQSWVEKNRRGYAKYSAEERRADTYEGRPPSAELLERISTEMGIAKLDTAARTVMEDIVRKIYFDAMSERDSRMSLQTRKGGGVSGFDTNMMRSFVSHARAEASLIARMEHGKAITQAMADMRREAVGPDLVRTYNLLSKHFTHTMKGTDTPIQNVVVSTNSVYMLLTAVGYYAANLTQPAMATIPTLAGDFNDYSGAMSALMNGYRIAFKAASLLDRTPSGFTRLQASVFHTDDQIKAIPPKYRPAIQRLQELGTLDVGLEDEVSIHERTDTGYGVLDKTTGTLATVTHKLYQLSRYVEAINRVSSAIAAVDMAEKHPSMLRKAGATDVVDYAVKVVSGTQGNFTTADAPQLLKWAGPVISQYRKFPIQMSWLFADAFKKAFRDTDPETRAVGRRTFSYLIAHATLFAGVGGIPLVNLVAPYIMAMIDDEEEPPRDIKRIIKDNIDGPLGEVLADGGFSLVGFGMANRLSLGNIMNPFPFVEMDSDPSIVDRYAGALLGPTGVNIKNVLRAYNYAREGDYMRTIEYAMPKGIRSIIESYRYATRGMQTTRGDVLVAPESFPTRDILVNAIGLPSARITNIKWSRNEQYEVERWFNERTQELRFRYIAARKDRDRERMQMIKTKWNNLQRAKVNMRHMFGKDATALKIQPLLNLYKAPNQQRQREIIHQRRLTPQ